MAETRGVLIRRSAVVLALLGVVAASVLLARRRLRPTRREPDRRGSIEFREEQPNGQSPRLFAVGVFFADWARTPGCSAKTIGVCRLESCTLGGQVNYPDAGLITIKGGLLPPTGLHLEPKASGVYETFAEERRLWTAGNTLSVRAEGKTVPEFDASVVVPPPLELRHFPVPERDAKWELDRRHGLDLSWTDTSADKVELVIAAITHAQGKRLTKLICSVSAQKTSAHIPSAALGALPAVTGPPDAAHLSVWSKNEKRFERGKWTLSVSVDAPARVSGRVAAAALEVR